MNGNKKALRIAIVGGGMGGTTAAILLQRAGHQVKLFEQSPNLTGAGAGINLDPQSMRIMRRLGVEERLLAIGRASETRLSRDWDSGNITLVVPVERYMELYNGNHFSIYRAELQEALSDAVAPGAIEMGKRLASLEQVGEVVHLTFEDGSKTEADLVIGADGINSKVRENLLGPEPPEFRGRVSYRAIIPAHLLGDFRTADHVKWWSPERYFLTYYLTNSRDVFYFTANVPEPDWGSTNYAQQEADMARVRAHFAGWHQEVQYILERTPRATRFAVRERDPLPFWSRGRIVLLGDACHPMPPFMGQGAAMAFEDAVILARCLENVGADQPERVFRLYEANRYERASKMQLESRKNQWLQYPMDPGWVLNYDPFEVPLIPLPDDELTKAA
jgi:6-hydroxynicotinate 3-monooxygenase